MKSLILGAAVAALAMAAAQTASAAEASQTHRPICLNTVQIDHTEVPDNSTILFYMHGGKVWKNTLRFPCPGLRFGPFAYSPDPAGGQICENILWFFRNLDSLPLQGGSVCSLGPFTPYTPPAKAKSDSKT